MKEKNEPEVDKKTYELGEGYRLEVDAKVGVFISGSKPTMNLVYNLYHKDTHLFTFNGLMNKERFVSSDMTPVNNPKSSRRRTNLIDLMRHWVERDLYSRGVREIMGKTNPKMAGFLSKRGYRIGTITAVNQEIEKHLTSEPAPPIWTPGKTRRPRK